jgi:ABC-type nickel/cobalt efflux system permease component RcnA
MTTVLSLIALGFFLGMRHATDPDHVIAVSTIVTRQQTLRGGVVIGGLWGVGHTVTIVLVGGAIILFSVVIPPALGLTMEMTVALMLVVLGLWNLTGILQRARDQLVPGADRHAQVHQHGDYVHSHRHGHGRTDHGHGEEQTPQAWLDRRLGGLGLYQVLRPLVVGLVHGLAGSAAVALLVLATISDPRWALAYLLLFGVGTIVGMMLITLLVAGDVAPARARRGLALLGAVASAAHPRRGKVHRGPVADSRRGRAKLGPHEPGPDLLHDEGSETDGLEGPR